MISMIKSLQELFQESFQVFYEPITELSYDDSNKQSLCISAEKMYNYDRIIRHLFKHGEAIATPDAVYFKDKKIIFVEFKNGFINERERKNLRLKAIEGAYIGLYTIIQRAQLPYSFEDIHRQRKEYYIVYNPIKNKKTRTNKIKHHLSAVSTRFGLERYQGIFFEKIHTISAKTFIDKLEFILK